MFLIFFTLFFVSSIFSTESLISLSSNLDLLNSIASKTSNRGDFFYEIMGIKEDEFIKLYKNKKSEIKEFFKENNLIKNIKTNETFQAGYFKQYSIKELRADNKKLKKLYSGKFNIIEANKPSNKLYRINVDIGAMQADPINNDAVFQVASNFSALEPVNQSDFPESGVSKYIYDYTQGPFASISAAPGLIYRMYYIFADKDLPVDYWRQTKDNQINLLSDTNIPNQNGYIVFSQKFLSKQIETDLIEKIKVGYHHDIQVIYGFLNNLKEHTKVNYKQVINQVFTAAVDFGNTNASFKNNKTAQTIAQIVLNAAYEGTLRSALINKKKKVFLTLIGGGVFNNSLESIATAIEKSKDIITDFDLDVTLIIYDNSKFDEKELEDFRNKLLKIVKATKGAYTLYK